MDATTVNDQEGLSLARCPNLVLLLDTPKGRGVYASAFIPSGTILETCPVLVLDQVENKAHIEKTELYHYTYNWPLSASTNDPSKDNRVTQAVVLGLGSMFNHSTQHQNVGWTRDISRQLITYRALRDIQSGEELCISYGSRLTFIDADAPEPEDEGDGSELLGSIELG